MKLGAKVGAGIGALGLGAATLALVGTGAFASFTGSVHDTTSITAGTFHEQVASATDPITDTCPSTGMMTCTGWKPTLGTDPVTTTTVNGTGVVTFTEATANPTATTTLTVVVYNSGTLAGSVTAVVYNNESATNALASYATIYVEQSECDNNKGGTLSLSTCGFSTALPISSHNVSTKRGTPMPLATAEFSGTTATTTLRYKGNTDSLSGYLQPNTASLGKRTTEAAVKYTVTVKFAKTTPNSAEGKTYKFALSFTGHNI